MCPFLRAFSSELLKKMYFRGLFTQVAQSVKSNYLLMGTAKDRLSETMELMTTRLTEPENRVRKYFLYCSIHPGATLDFTILDRIKVSVEMSFILSLLT